MAAENHVKLVLDGDIKRYEVVMKRAQDIARQTKKSTSGMTAANDVMSKSFQSAATATAALHGPLNGVSGRLSSLATAFRLANTGVVLMGAALTAASVLVTKSIRDFAAYEVQLKRLIAVQEATGHSAGFTGEQINEMSREIAMATLATTAGVAQAAAALGTFGSVTGDAFERTLRVSQDVAEVMGTDIRAAAVQMGKALEDPEKGLTSLSRAGVTFTKAAEEQIETAVRFGDVMAAQAIILREVEGQLGGVAEAVASDTISGAFDTLTQNVEDLGIKLAETTGIGAGFRGFIEWLSSISDKVKGVLAGILPEDIDSTIAKMKELDASIENAEAQGGDSSYFRVRSRNLAKHLDNLRVLKKKADDAEVAGEAAARANADEARAAASEKILSDFNKHHAKMESVRLQAVAGIAGGAGAEAKENVRFQRQVQRVEELYRKQREAKQLHDEQQLILDQQHKATIEALETQHHTNLDDIRKEAALAGSNEAMRVKLAEQTVTEKNLKLQEEQIEQYELVADAGANMFSTLAEASEKGSAAMRTFVIAEKAALLASAIANMFAAANRALSMDAAVTTASRIANYAAVLATGAQAVSAISSLTIASRAMGGPTRPYSSYWVGERGPEIITTGSRPGMVTPTKDLAPTVIINEDATRAGEVSYDAREQTVSVAVAAVMSKLTDDMNSGRGVFGAAEMRYGLRRQV